MGAPFNAKDATFALTFEEVEPGVAGIVPFIAPAGVLPTFTRATAASTRLSTGNWKLDVAAGKPRFHYSRDGTKLRFLPEGSRTQILTGADVRDMTTANWTATNCTVTKNAAGIDGVSSAACTLTATGANATVLLTVTAAATSRTYGAFIRRVSGTGGIALTQDGAAFTTVTVDDRYPEIQQQLNATQLNAVIGIRIATSGDSIVVDFNQFEAGTFSSTPIPIATVTRNADVLSYAFTGNANVAGTLFGQFAFLSGTVALTQVVAGFSDNTTSNYISLEKFNANVSANIVTATVTQAAMASTATVAGTQLKGAMAWAANDGAASFNAGTVGTDASVTLPTVTLFGVGNTGGVNAMFGTVSRNTYWRQAFRPNILQALTR